MIYQVTALAMTLLIVGGAFSGIAMAGLLLALAEHLGRQR